MSADLNGTTIAPNMQQPATGQTPTQAPSGWEATSLARQYGDPAKAEAAVIELRNYASRTMDEKRALEQRVQQLEGIASSVIRGGRPDPGALISAREQLAQELALSNPQLISAAVREALADEMRPVMRAQEALTQLEASNPDFAKRKNEVLSWVYSNPEVSQKFQSVQLTDPQIAFEWADAQYLRHQVSSQQPATVSQRNAAALPGGSPSGMSVNQPTQLQDLERQGLQFGQETGDMSHYRASRIAQTGGYAAFSNWLASQGLIPG